MIARHYINKAVAIKRKVVQNYNQYKHDREINKLVDYIINIDVVTLKQDYDISKLVCYKNNMWELLEEISQNILKKNPLIDKQLLGAYNLLAYIIVCDLEVDTDELLVGTGRYRPFNKYPGGVPDEVDKMIKDCMISEEEGQTILDAWKMSFIFRASGGHVVPGYDRVINNGYGAILTQIKKIEDINYKRASEVAIMAAQKLILRYGLEAEKKGLCDIFERCNRIISSKPNCFVDALQLLWLAHEVMLLEGDIKGISLGRIDQYLYPFYKKDIEEGKITDEQVSILLKQFWKKFCFDRETLSFQNITIGGLKTDNEDGSNELTIHCMNAQLATRASQPMLSLRTNKFTSKQVWDKAMEVISTGMGVPALFNDSIAISALENVGLHHEDALDYSIVGCVELTAGGREYSHTEGLRINLIKLLEIMLFGKDVKQGLCWKLHEQLELDNLSYRDLVEWYKRELRYLLDFFAKKLILIEDNYGKYWPVPYLSALMEGCIEKEKDVTRGGTKYNNTCINFAGVANLVNSFIAIKEMVYEKGLSFEKVKDILLMDYEGYDDILGKIQKLPKFGNDIDEVDELAKEITQYIIDELKDKRNHRGGRFKPGFYTVHLHGWMGENSIATFDGRKDGKALASSLSPAQGTDISGPLAVFNSLTKLPHDKMANGMVCDIKFSKTFFDNQQIDKIENVIKTYFDNGGMEVQLNVVNRDTLIKAQKNPEEYKNLIVRVSGFSTYFVNLSKQLQDEVILRYENKAV